MGRKVTFRRADRDGFRLETADVEEPRGLGRLWPFGRKRVRRAGWLRYISAGGTRTTRAEQSDEVEADVRSWQRFAFALTAVIVIWLLGAFL